MLRPEVAVYLSPTVAWVVTGQATYMGEGTRMGQGPVQLFIAFVDLQWLSHPHTCSKLKGIYFRASGGGK